MTTVGLSTAGAPPMAQTNTGRTRWISLSGVAFALLLAGSVLLTAGEPSTSNAAKLQKWAVKHTTLFSVSTLVTVLAVVVGLYYLTWLHSRFTEGQRSWAGTMFITGVLVFAGSGGIAAGLTGSMGGDAKHLTAGSLQLLDSLQNNLNYPMTCIGLTLMYLAAGLLIRQTGLLPRWLAWVSWVFAFCAVTFVLGFIALFGSALWMIFTGIYLTMHRPAQS